MHAQSPRSLFAPLIFALSVSLLTSPPAHAQKSGKASPVTAQAEEPPPSAPSSEAPPAADPPPAALPPTPAPARSDWRDPTERPGSRNLFVGLFYRGTVVPKFMMNLFVDEGATAYSNTGGIFFDIRRDHFSVMPYVAFTEYGLSDTLFLQKDKDASVAANYSLVNSSLKTIYGGVDLLWSAKLHKYVDFEYGLGVGVAVVWGDLVVNWVYETPGGPLVGSNGRHYAGCRTEADGPGCSRLDHTNGDTPKVNRYVERSWFSGGPAPSLYARLSVPILGLRIKPTRDLELRVHGGFALTEGFFFGLSAAYRLPFGN